MKNTYLGRIADRTRLALKKLIVIAAGGYILGTTLYANGCMDSERTGSAERILHDDSNLVKAVKSVSEEWSGIDMLSPTLDGYNPCVKRTVIFEDESRTTLVYHTLAWEPFKTWLNGRQFKPKVGEKYEVTGLNSLVRKIE